MSRMINIILTELASDILKYEEAMESTINSKEDINDRVETIKNYLGKIVQTELMIEKWKSYTKIDNPDNNLNG